MKKDIQNPSDLCNDKCLRNLFPQKKLSSFLKWEQLIGYLDFLKRIPIAVKVNL